MPAAEGYAWVKLAPEGDCPKCGEPDCFKRTPLYLSSDDQLHWSCETCGFEVTTPPLDRQEK